MNGFQCFFDKWGDLHVTGGVVLDLRSGAKFYAGAGALTTALGEDKDDLELTAAKAALTTDFVGGSGRNLFSEGLAARYSGAAAPIGWWKAANPGVWKAGIFTLHWPATGNPWITDGTDVVAIWSAGTAPAGDYDSTTYGKDTYGEIVSMVATHFTLTVTAEGGTSVGVPPAIAAVSAGTAEGGAYLWASGTYSGDSMVFEHETAAGWTLTILTDGSAEISDGTDVVASRPAGADPWTSVGVYEATTYGKETYNWITADPDDPDAVDEGGEFQITVMLRGLKPRAGSVFYKLTDSLGDLTAVEGPFFGTLPAGTANTFYVPVAESDGLGGLEQLHTGMLVWHGSGAAKRIAWGTVAASTDTGVAGDTLMDGDYLYGCVAADTWARIAWDLTPWP